MALRTYRCAPHEACDCAECGQPIISKGWRDDASGQVFCCPGCSITYRTGRRQNPGHASGGDEPERCCVCGLDTAYGTGRHAGRVIDGEFFFCAECCVVRANPAREHLVAQARARHAVGMRRRSRS